MGSYDLAAVRYARTLLDAAKAAGPVGPVLAGLQELRSLLADHAGLQAFLRHPGIERAEKLQVLERVTGGRWPDLVRGFVALVLSFGRAGELAQMAEAFEDVVREDERRLRAVVRSARPLSGLVLTRVQRMLERVEQATVEVETEVDPALLGGFQVFVGFRVFDGSVRKELQDLRQRLATVPVGS